ncbi:MAG TPA: phytanoyl-CoA dioxygenase family protein [Chthonomonadaceae bacterium]|nr:phytanoyl-CoA dioxygenase family protein [Chthonomonadaceae bacterium]
MLRQDQVEFYKENGFLAVEGVISLPLIEEARQVVEDFVERSRAVMDHDSVYDLEPGHSAQEPRVRRLKEPCAIHPIFQQIGCCQAVLDCVEALIGPGVRYQASKLNMKSAAFGSPVEWHQDFAFYPHTNDDLLAVGVALDDCTLENGCMLMIPGSHRGPILDHHQEGVFVGAVDVAKERVETARAVPVPVRAGGITLHHCRTLHASAPNTSEKPRRLFLIQYTAVDAWPVMGVRDLEAFDAQILRGMPTRRYRVKEMDMRVPLPMPERQGSIYEIQTAFRPKVFAAR